MKVIKRSLRKIYEYYQYVIKTRNVNIYGKIYINNIKNVTFGKNVGINNGVYINPHTAKIHIGNNVAISANAIIVATKLDPYLLIVEKVNQHLSEDIVIGNNVQIGAGAIILPGITIQDNVIVGAGTVVTKSIVSNCVVVGNPGKVVKRYE